MINPLQYFEVLFTEEKSQNLKRMMISDRLELVGENLIKVDTVRGIITSKEFSYNGSDFIENECIWTFDTTFENQINSEIVFLKQFILDKSLEISLEGKNTKLFLEQLIIKFEFYKLKAKSLYAPYSFVQKLLSSFLIFLEEQKPKVVETNERISASANIYPFATPASQNSNYSDSSFKWDLINPEDAGEQLIKLYKLLVQSPPMIECSMQQFIDAFTEKEVQTGIKWMLTSVKNRQPSKVSLIYFIKQLIERSDLEDDQINFNRKIEYVFRDYNGGTFQNIKQSKSQMSDTPDHYMRIDELIDSFLES